jgi:hypothetical protein
MTRFDGCQPQQKRRMTMDFSTQIQDLDNQIAQAKTYLKMLRAYRRTLAAIATEEAAIASVSVNSPSLSEAETGKINDTQTTDTDAEFPLEPPTPDSMIGIVLPYSSLVPQSFNPWQAMNRQQLRDACKQHGIIWRNAKGANQHLTRDEMIAALDADEMIADKALSLAS